MSYDLRPIVAELLSVVPELKTPYLKLAAEEKKSKQKLTKEDLEELEQIADVHNLPKSNLDEPGEYLVFEDLLVAYMLRLAEEKEFKRLSDILSWLEKLASHHEFDVRNLIAIAVCEPLITTYQSKLQSIVPFMGQKTKALCTMQFERFRVRDETKRLFGIT